MKSVWFKHFFIFFFTISCLFQEKIFADDTLANKIDLDQSNDSVFLTQVLDYLNQQNDTTDFAISIIADATSIICNSSDSTIIHLGFNFINILKALGNFKSTSTVYQCIANYYKMHGDLNKYINNANYSAYFKLQEGAYEESAIILFENLKLAEEKQLNYVIPETYMFLGFNIRFSNKEKAMEYFLQCIEKTNDTLSRDYHVSLNEVGNLYSNNGNTENALAYQYKALRIRTFNNDSIYIAYSYHDIALTYFAMGNYDKAIEFTLKSLEVFEYKSNLIGIISANSNLVNQYFKKNDIKTAKSYLNQSLQLAEKMDNNYAYSIAYNTAYEFYKQTEDYEKALNYLELSKIIEDQIKTKTIDKQIEELHILYEIETKEKQINLQETIIEKKNLQRNIFIIFFLFTILIALLILRNYYIKKKTNQLISEKNQILEMANHEIAEQHKEVVKQNEIIKDQNKHITDSIEYAKFIQKAMLTGDDLMRQYLNEYFVIFKPKDIVSGDFYWAKAEDNKLLFAAVDCTGHGVPGAFMSILGMTFLNEITISSKELKTNVLLDKLREKVKEALHQEDSKHQSTDGMDMAIIIIDFELRELEFSGANLPVYIASSYKNEILTELKPDFMPIGIYAIEKPFNSTKTKLNKNDAIYLFSDGYIDQFSEVDRKKFMSTQLKQLITEIHHKPMSEQSEIFEQRFNEHKGNHQQIDDVMLIGIRV